MPCKPEYLQMTYIHGMNKGVHKSPDPDGCDVLGKDEKRSQSPLSSPLSLSQSRSRSLSVPAPSVRPSVLALLGCHSTFLHGRGREKQREKVEVEIREGREGGRKDALPRSCVRSRARAPRCEAGGKTKVNWEEKKERSDDRDRQREGTSWKEGGRKTCTIRVSGLN